jgi:nucleotide-binding universal stress UspA family protein
VRGKAEAIIPAYAQLVGARAIVVERNYGTPRIWRSAAVVRRLSRSSPVPVLVLPAQGPALDRVTRGDISRVVVAVDSSVGSAVALRTGMALARRHDARLTMLHAIKNVPDHMVFSGSEAWRVMQRLPAQKRQMAGQLRQRAALLGHANAHAQVVTGDPGSAIVSAASEADTDLVVLGVAPRTALDQWVFGSTLRTVLRRARTPVLVVPVIGGAEQWYENTFGENASRALAERSLTARTAA